MWYTEGQGAHPSEVAALPSHCEKEFFAVRKTSRHLARRAVAGVLALGLALSLSGCVKKGEQARFDQYLSTLPTAILDSDSLDVNYLFQDPEAHGFSLELLQLPYADAEDYRESKATCQEILKTLQGFDERSLDPSSRLTLQILKDSFQRNLLTLDDYYLDNNYLGSFLGFQAQLPMLLENFYFERQNDLDSYFNILRTCGEIFHLYAENERARQENGCGMCQSILDKVIEQCETFAAQETPYLVPIMDEKIDGCAFLSEGEKAEAKATSHRLLEGELMAAYRQLAEELSQIDAPEEELGLAHQPGGKDYYLALLQKTTGIDWEMDEVKTFLHTHMAQAATDMGKRMQALQKSDPAIYRELMEGATPAYSRFSSVEETLDYLGEAMLQDFPATENLTYQIRPVDESMKDNFSPAAYLKSRIDKPLGSPQMIYINGEYSTDLFSTIAHEGYPGHMYQNTYFQNLQLPTIRYMIDYNGYSEGWATYVENSSYKYATEDRELAELYSYNDRYTQCVIALADIGLHYDGWNYDQFAAFLKTYFGDEMDDEVLRSQFYLNLETPTNYLQYYLTGMAYQDLYDGAEEQLGERFSPVEFNRVLLETGPASLDILQQQVDSYVKTAKGGAQKAA